MIKAVTPPKVKQLAQLATAIERWELKVYQLEREHGEKMSSKMKTAVLTGMCPQDIQDVVFQNMEANTEYTTIRDKIRNLVANRVMTASMPVPMDIGEVEAEGYWDGLGNWWPMEYEGAEDEIGAIGQDCYFCGKSGHYARDCPAKGAEKGKGKGIYKGGYKGGGFQGYGGKSKGKGKEQYGKGYGEQYAKGFGKDSGKGKGKGKNFQGNCWQCGGQGHRAADCSNVHYAGVESPEIQQAGAEESIGGIWEVGCVEVHVLECTLQQQRKRQTQQQQPRQQPIRTANRFEALEEEFDVGSTSSTGGKMLAEFPDLGEELEIGAVDAGYGRDGQITIDSGAAESVMPKDSFLNIPFMPADRHKSQAKYVAANGSRMGNYGQKRIPFKMKGGEGAQSIVFQVTDVTKPLAAVSRIVEKGNVVQFGPRPEDNFIRSESGKKIPIRRERGTYVIDVEFNDGLAAAGFPRQA
jgi:hypothetical protein